MYDQSTGEFISRDPLEYVDGMSQYRAYFLMNAVDPLGRKSTWTYDPLRPSWIDGARFDYHVPINIYLPNKEDWPEPGDNGEVKGLQFWQINTSRGFYIKKNADGECETVRISYRIIDIADVADEEGNLSERFVYTNDGKDKPHLKDTSQLEGPSSVCFGIEWTIKKSGFNSATNLYEPGMYEVGEDVGEDTWTTVSTKMRPPFGRYVQHYIFYKPDCECCMPDWMHGFLRHYEAIDANGELTSWP